MQNCGQIMRYAVATGRAERNPVADLKGALTPAKEAHHAAITTPVQLGGLLRSAEAYSGSAITRSALRLAALAFLRPGELRHAEWEEFDLDTAVWTIPASKMKMHAAHIVPLSRQTLQILGHFATSTEISGCRWSCGSDRLTSCTGPATASCSRSAATG